MVGHFISRLFEGTLHVDKIHMRFKIADITHIYTTRSSPPVDRFHTETGGRFANDLLILTCSEEMNRNRLLHTYRLTRLPSL